MQSDRAVGEKVLSQAADVMRSGAITKLEVLYYPKEMLTRTRLNPELLEKQYYYKISIERFQSSKLKSEMISAFENSAIKPAAIEPDLRWACIFYNTNNDRVLTMYFDASGKKGIIDGVSVVSDGRLVKLLESRCSSLWE